MTRKWYFYRDPLAAAWMMKHFKMRIHTGGGDTCDFRADFCMDRYEEDLLSAGGKLYIHIGSVSLLEPQDGDIIAWDYPKDGEFKESHCYYVITEGHNHNHFPADAKRLIEMTGARIIQRNGVAFMWPENEDAKFLSAP